MIAPAAPLPISMDTYLIMNNLPLLVTVFVNHAKLFLEEQRGYLCFGNWVDLVFGKFEAVVGIAHFRPIAIALHHRALLELTEHEYHVDALLINHSPELVHSIGQRLLSCNNTL